MKYGISRANSVVLPAPLHPASPITFMPFSAAKLNPQRFDPCLYPASACPAKWNRFAARTCADSGTPHGRLVLQKCQAAASDRDAEGTSGIQVPVPYWSTCTFSVVTRPLDIIRRGSAEMSRSFARESMISTTIGRSSESRRILLVWIRLECPKPICPRSTVRTSKMQLPRLEHDGFGERSTVKPVVFAEEDAKQDGVARNLHAQIRSAYVILPPARDRKRAGRYGLRGCR